MRFFALPIIWVKRGLHDLTLRRNKALILNNPGADVKPDFPPLGAYARDFQATSPEQVQDFPVSGETRPWRFPAGGPINAKGGKSAFNNLKSIY